LSSSQTINHLVLKIFELVHILKNDLGNDAKFEDAQQFVKLYQSDDPKLRPLGMRRLGWIRKEHGIISTSGDEFYLRSVLMFVTFVEDTTSEVCGEVSATTFSVGCPTGRIDTELSVENIITLLHLLDNSSGNPSDIIEDNSGNSEVINRKSSSRARPNSRSYSTFSGSKRRFSKGKELFRYLLITKDHRIITFYSPFKVKMDKSLYDDIILSFED